MTYTDIQRLKAKITRLYAHRSQNILLGAEEQVRLVDESPSIYHLVRKWKRCTRSHVAMVKDEEGVVHMASREILDIFTRALEIKLQEHRIDGTAMERMLAHVKKEIPPGEQDALYLPFTDVELHNAVMS